MSQTLKSDNFSKQIAEIWELLKENARQQKEDRLQLKEAKKQWQEQQKKDRLQRKEAKKQWQEQQKEDRLQLKEAKKQWQEQSKEADRKWQERLDKRIHSMEGLFTNQWGKLVEALAAESLTSLMKEHGLILHNIHTHVKCAYKDQEREFDIIATNGQELVTVEVKTTLKPDDVRVFIQNMKDFKNYFSEYVGFKVYGAVAYLQVMKGAMELAMREGLYMIRAAGKNAVLKNPRGFVPKEWNPEKIASKK